MYRGTTPTITINCDIDVSEFVTMWVTFRTQQLATYAPPKQVEVTKHLGDEGVDATGKVVRKVRAKSIDNMKRKIRKFRGLVDSGKITLDSVVQSYASWTGHISHGNTYHLRQNMDAYFFSYFQELKPSPKGDTTHGPKTEQPRKQVEGQVRQPVRQPDHLDRGR